jgi:hypothetical protein
MDYHRFWRIVRHLTGPKMEKGGENYGAAHNHWLFCPYLVKSIGTNTGNRLVKP